MSDIFPYVLVDLTHTLENDIPTWDDSCGFNHSLSFDYDPNAEFQFRTHEISMKEGIGTHMDSPAHCIKGAATIDEIDLNKLISPCIVIDVSDRAHEKYVLSVEDIILFETKYTKISEGDFVVIKTGWEKRWEEKDKYRNNLIYPSVSKEAAELLSDRGISGIAIDTLSPDTPDNGFHTHKILLGNDKYIVENAANLNAISPTGDFIMVVPIKIKDGTESPIRLIGLKEKNK